MGFQAGTNIAQRVAGGELTKEELDKLIPTV